MGTQTSKAISKTATGRSKGERPFCLHNLCLSVSLSFLAEAASAQGTGLYGCGFVSSSRFHDSRDCPHSPLHPLPPAIQIQTRLSELRSLPPRLESCLSTPMSRTQFPIPSDVPVPEIGRIHPAERTFSALQVLSLSERRCKGVAHCAVLENCMFELEDLDRRGSRGAL